MMTPENIAKLAFLVYPHITKTGLDQTSVESLAKKIEDLHRGLSPEDEFAAKVSWLGNCAGINRIDQTPMEVVEVDGKMRAPDFIAFPVVNGKPFPVLVEVKSKLDEKLDWSESYYSSLRRFADSVNLPLLVAWKCGAIWTLFDHREFRKNVSGHRITLLDAMRQDLSTALFRDLRIIMDPELQLVFDMDLLDEVEGDADTLLPEGTFRFQITEFGFYRLGTRIAS